MNVKKLDNFKFESPRVKKKYKKKRALVDRFLREHYAIIVELNFKNSCIKTLIG